MEINKELKALQKRILKTKKDLKEWESVFAKKHGRPPTIQDISQRPGIEKFYKKYNALKKELKQETERLKTESPLTNSPPRSSQTSPTTTRSVIGTNTRRNSVEFVRSPSHPMPRRKPSIFDSSSSSQQTVRRLSEFEEMKSALASVSSSSQTSALNSSQQQRTLTEDEAFWLDIPSTPSTTTSYSQPIPSSTSSSTTTTATAFQFSTTSSNSQQEEKPKKKRQLVLGGGSSQPIISTKRSLKQLKLFGMAQNPFQRAINSPQLSPTSIEASSPGSSTSSPRPPFTSTTTKSIVEAEYEEDDEDEQIEIVNHEFDPFKNYDPSLFHWQDPSFSIGPGFFSQVTSSIPILNDPKRRSRVLYKLEKGTLGEVHEENKRMEEEISEDLRAFIAANSQLDTLEAALTSIDENLLNKPEYNYKKKPLQKRQTKLYKMKFVETRI